MQQEDLDQAYDAMIDDYMTGEIHLLSNKNLLYCIDKFWLLPALEDVPVIDVLIKLLIRFE